jgi:hypothetical protein
LSFVIRKDDDFARNAQFSGIALQRNKGAKIFRCGIFFAALRLGVFALKSLEHGV